MKKILSVVIALFVVSSSYSQNNFKEVKTAQDVIDNYITAIGGRDKLKKIKSETVTGKFKVQDFEGIFFDYRNDTIHFTKAEGNMEGKNMLLFKSVTTKNNAWKYQMGVMKEYTDAELLGKVEDLITGGISFYLNYNKKGYTSELKGIDTVKGKECYKVLFSKSGNEVKTNYYDKKTFYFIKSVNPNNTNIELDNYKDVKGIFRPFKLVQSSEVEIEVTEYQFTKPIDTKLLSKP